MKPSGQSLPAWLTVVRQMSSQSGDGQKRHWTIRLRWKIEMRKRGENFHLRFCQYGRDRRLGRFSCQRSQKQYLPGYRQEGG